MDLIFKQYGEQVVTEYEDQVWSDIFHRPRVHRPDTLLEGIGYGPMRNDTINEMIEYVWRDVKHGSDFDWDQVWCNYDSAYQKKLIKRIFKQPIKLYRAGSLDSEYQSWTFSRDVAVKFIWRQFREEDKVIHERYFDAKDVVAIFNQRKEKEVVIKDQGLPH